LPYRFEIIALKYPSSKNFILLVIAIIIIISAFLISEYENRIVLAQQNASYGDSQAEVELATTTMYNTSVAYQGNWQKALLDAFGTSSAWLNGKIGSVMPETTLTPTDIFGEDLFSKYAQYEQAGADFNDPQTQQEIVGQVMSDGTYIPTPKVYNENNIKIINNSSNTALINYGNAIGNIINDDATIETPELTIVQQSLNANDPTILKQLDPIVVNYQKILNGFLAMPVPAPLANFHLSLVNSISELLFADQNLTKVYSDSLVSLSGLGQYQKGAQDFAAAFSGIAQYFNTAGITFGPNDGGYVFMPKTKTQ